MADDFQTKANFCKKFNRPIFVLNNNTDATTNLPTMNTSFANLNIAISNGNQNDKSIN